MWTMPHSSYPVGAYTVMLTLASHCEVFFVAFFATFSLPSSGFRADALRLGRMLSGLAGWVAGRVLWYHCKKRNGNFNGNVDQSGPVDTGACQPWALHVLWCFWTSIIRCYDLHRR